MLDVRESARLESPLRSTALLQLLFLQKASFLSPTQELEADVVTI